MFGLTDEGKEVLESAPSLLQDHFRIELEKLADWERSLVLSTLQRIAAMMDAQQIDAAPVLTAGPMVASVEEVTASTAKSTLPEEA
ncbi:MAG: hypothetical protein ACE5KS_04285, partial [Woeseiaceae bacterium]